MNEGDESFPSTMTRKRKRRSRDKIFKQESPRVLENDEEDN
jgi:hypothetical protein